MIALAIDKPVDVIGRPFDGIKGVPQSFRPNGQMRQRLLLVDDNGKIVAEAPIRGVVDGNDLDTLGQVSCGK